MLNNKIVNIFNKIGHLLFLFILSGIFLVMTSYFIFDYNTQLYAVGGRFSYNGFIFILTLFLIIAVGYFCYRVLRKINFNIRINRMITLIFIFTMIIGIQIYCLNYITVEPTWDFEAIYKEAIHLVENNTNQISNVFYFSQYTNNNDILVIHIFLFKYFAGIFNNNYFLLALVANIIVIDLSLFINYFSVKKIYDSYTKAIYFMFLCMLCFPIYTYIIIFYTDTFPMLYGSLILFFYVCLYKSQDYKKSIIYSILIGIIALWGFYLKATLVIFLIAILIHLFFVSQKKKTLISLIIILSSFMISNYSHKQIFNYLGYFDTMQYERYQFPYEHWVMMGLNNIGGGASQDDVTYTQQFHSYDLKKENNIKEIKRRIKKYGGYELIRHFYHKTVFTYCDGTYYSSILVERKPLHPQSLGYNIFADKGTYYPYTMYIFNGVHYLFIALVLISTIVAFKRKTMDFVSVLRLCFFGLILFLYMWESKPKYLVNFLPIFYIIAYDGLLQFKAFFNQLKGHIILYWHKIIKVEGDIKS